MIEKGMNKEKKLKRGSKNKKTKTRKIEINMQKNLENQNKKGDHLHE
jgi:hypothetical protein